MHGKVVQKLSGILSVKCLALQLLVKVTPRPYKIGPRLINFDKKTDFYFDDESLKTSMFFVGFCFWIRFEHYRSILQNQVLFD